ncbi:MAG: tail fiber domain-containing protein [Candidatus Paceibacterota bacterium]
MKSMFSYIKKHKTFFLAIGFLVLFASSVSFATPPTSPYTAGETLDPSCAPGSSNCTVAISSGGTSQWDDVTGGINYAAGRVGIGTTTPIAALDLEGDGAIVASGTLGSGITPDIGGGTRLAWIPSKSAFRAGTVGSNQWDMANTGDYSTAFGENTIASGLVSTAFGNSTTASGAYSLAGGIDSIASGQNSLSFGDTTTASGGGSLAFGNNSLASGDGSLAFGSTTTASAFLSTAFGYNSGATGSYSTAFGYQTVASTNSATAFGYQTTASAYNATAFGYGTTASGDTSTAFGTNTIASAPYSTAFGFGSHANSYFSTAFGYQTTASSDGATSFGYHTTASQSNATAFGESTTASGVDSTAFGNNTVASGSGATALGFSTLAQSYLSVALGTFNVGEGSTGGWVSTDTIFEIGNGVDTNNRSNAFTVLKNGNTGINTATPIAALNVAGDGAVIATGTFSSGIAVPDLGAGTRMMWIPSKSAFRFGTVSGTQWDNASVGNYSTAFGRDTTASGQNSAAFGFNTTAASLASVAIGRYNVGGGSATTWTGTDPLFEIGNGTGVGTEANAFTILKNGKTTMSTTNIPTGNFVVGVATTNGGPSSLGVNIPAAAYSIYQHYISIDQPNNQVLLSSGNGDNGGGVARPGVNSGEFRVFSNYNQANTASYITFYTAGTQRAIFDIDGHFGIGSGLSATSLLTVGRSTTAAGNVAHFETATGTCDLDPANVGGLTCTSDMNAKKNITLLADNSAWSFNTNITQSNNSVFAKIIALQPVQYNFKAESDSEMKHTGFIAQDVEQIFPELVDTDSQGRKTLNYTGLVPYTVQAIKDINLNIQNIGDLTKTNSWRDSLIAWFGSAGNGIKSIVVHDSVCVDDQCLTKEDIHNLLLMEKSQQGTTTTPTTTTVITPTAPVDQGSTTQTPEVSVPIITPETSTPETAPVVPDPAQ